MANTIIKPTFSSEADRLTFLSRLWGITITAQDILDWQAHKALEPIKLVTETDGEWYQRWIAWNETRLRTRAVNGVSPYFVLSKWDSYGLGPFKRAAVVTLLNGRTSVSRTLARQAVDAHVFGTEASPGKFRQEILANGISVANDLLPLVQGLEW